MPMDIDELMQLEGGLDWDLEYAVVKAVDPPPVATFDTLGTASSAGTTSF